MRISDWSSDVCSSDLTEQLHAHKSKAEAFHLRLDQFGQRGDIRHPFSSSQHALLPPAPFGASPNIFDDVEKMRSHIAVSCSCKSEEHTSELQSLMRITYAVFCLKKTKHNYI